MDGHRSHGELGLSEVGKLGFLWFMRCKFGREKGELVGFIKNFASVVGKTYTDLPQMCPKTNENLSKFFPTTNAE